MLYDDMVKDKGFSKTDYVVREKKFLNDRLSFVCETYGTTEVYLEAEVYPTKKYNAWCSLFYTIEDWKFGVMLKFGKYDRPALHISVGPLHFDCGIMKHHWEPETKEENGSSKESS